jgi:hypothetical protein
MWRARRLHIQFYLAIVATLAVFVLASVVFWYIPGSSRGEMWTMDTAARLADSLLPAATTAPAEQQQAIQSLHQRLGMDLALYDAQGQLIGAAGGMQRLTPQRLSQKGWTFSHSGPVWILQLSGERRLVVRPRHMQHAPTPMSCWCRSPSCWHSRSAHIRLPAD